MATETVLITGATGFVGSHITLDLLERGTYKIKAVAAISEARRKLTLGRRNTRTVKDIDWALFGDLSAPGSFDALMSGVHYVIHTATPVMLGFKDNEKDMLIPAIEGVMSVMRAAAKQPSVKRVIITGSFDDWNPTTYEEAARSPPGTAGVYSASKALAEKAAWNFVESEKPSFTYTSLCAPIIYGPPAQVIDSIDKLPASCAEMWAIFSGKQQDLSHTPWPWFVDVRDVARLHVEALTNDKAQNQRYLTCGGYESYNQIAHIAATAYPEQAYRIAPSDNSDPPSHAILDSSKAQRDFGITWTSLDKCITDMAGVMYAREIELGATHHD